MPTQTKQDNLTIKEAVDQYKETYNPTTLIAALAKELGVSIKTIYNYMDNPDSMSPRNYIKMCIILQLTPEELLGMQDYNEDVKSIIDKYLANTERK